MAAPNLSKTAAFEAILKALCSADEDFFNHTQTPIVLAVPCGGGATLEVVKNRLTHKRDCVAASYKLMSVAGLTYDLHVDHATPDDPAATRRALRAAIRELRDSPRLQLVGSVDADDFREPPQHGNPG